MDNQSLLDLMVHPHTNRRSHLKQVRTNSITTLSSKKASRPIFSTNLNVVLNGEDNSLLRIFYQAPCWDIHQFGHFSFCIYPLDPILITNKEVSTPKGSYPGGVLRIEP